MGLCPKSSPRKCPPAQRTQQSRNNTHGLRLKPEGLRSAARKNFPVARGPRLPEREAHGQRRDHCERTTLGTGPQPRRVPSPVAQHPGCHGCLWDRRPKALRGPAPPSQYRPDISALTGVHWVLNGGTPRRTRRWFGWGALGLPGVAPHALKSQPHSTNSAKAFARRTGCVSGRCAV